MELKSLDGEIIIEKAHPDDAEQIQNVFYKTWLATYPNSEAGVTVEDINELFKEKISAEGIQKSQKRIEEGLKLDNQKFVVAKINGKVVGVCLATTSDEINQLNAIYVLPEFQGRGIGYQLWNEVFNFFDTTKDTIVEVVTYNHPAIKFYNRLGFEDTGKRMVNEKFNLRSGTKFTEMEIEITKQIS